MRLVEYLCLGGTEISNINRTYAYINNIGIPGMDAGLDCGCSILDDEYIIFSTPEADDAPWYSPDYPASGEFLGMVADNAETNSPLSRDVSQKAYEGAIIGSPRLKHRLVQVRGHMVATTARGMAYGQAWLREVLRGSFCLDGCASDDLIILPACPEGDEYFPEDAFRTLRNAGTVSGPDFDQEGDLPECNYQKVAFQIAAGIPYMYFPATACVEDTLTTTNDINCLTSTSDWVDATLLIDIIANDALQDLGEITITGTTSLDGQCPIGIPASNVMPCFQYVLPERTLHPGDRIIIDGTRRKVRFYDATEKFETGGLKYLDFEGYFNWPDIPACTDLCLNITMPFTADEDGDAAVVVESYRREL